MATKRKPPMGHNLVRYRLKCVSCLEWFNCSRPDAAFCSGKCRQADYRLRQKAEAQARALAVAQAGARKAGGSAGAPAK